MPFHYTGDDTFSSDILYAIVAWYGAGNSGSLQLVLRPGLSSELGAARMAADRTDPFMGRRLTR